MWRIHTSLLVILAIEVSSLSASEQIQLKPLRLDRKILMKCPSDTSIGYLELQKRGLPSRLSDENDNGIRKELTPDGVIEISSDITTNQIWTAGNTYHITANINVMALLVIEPGTLIKFAPNMRMAVNNGGTLISAGTPDNPITYTSDSADPWYGDYYCAIFIDETASASTKITYSYIEYAEVGIWVMNNRLDSPIENNYLYHNSFGILEYGIEHTDVYNNLIYASYYNGIEINMKSYEGLADADSHILIQNNTCDYYQDVGIAVFGVDNDYEAGEVTLTNNIVSGSYQCGLVLANGWMYFTVANTGYYDNELNKNWEFEEYNPVIETTLPYVDGTGTLPVCYLNPNSTFVNASDEYIEQTRLIGKTTDINGFPDSNKTDLGFHYPNWNFSNAGSSTLYADFDNNYRVDYNDLSEFADYWLYDYNYNYQCWWWDWFEDGVIDLYDLKEVMNYWLSPYDFSDFADFAYYWRRQVDYKFEDRRFDLVADNFVDFKDYSKFAEQWRQIAETANPAIVVTVSGEPNNLTGKVDVGIGGRAYNTTEGFIYLDGELKGYIDYTEDPETTYEFASVDTQTLGNGQHDIKAAVIDTNGLITVSPIISVNMNNDLYYITKADDFNEGEDYHLYAMSNSPNEFRVKLTGWDSNNVYTSSPSVGGLNVVVSSDVLTGPLYEVVIEMETGTLLSWETMHDDSITRRKPKKGNYKVAIFLPNGRFRGTGVSTSDCRMQAVAELIRWCEQRNMPYIVLYRGVCTWLNFATVLSNPTVKYVYMVAHGNYFVEYGTERVNRMYFVISGPLGFSTDKVVSYKGDLPGNMDTSWRVHSMQSLGLYQTPRIRLVYMTVCHLGQENNTQMAEQWLMYDPIPLNQLFCGWQNETENNQYWKDWDYDFWHYIGSGGDNAWWVYNRIQRPDENLFGPEIAGEFQMYGDDQVRFNP